MFRHKKCHPQGVHYFLLKFLMNVCASCEIKIRTQQQQHSRCIYGHTPTYTHTHTHFVILLNFMKFLTNFHLVTCTFQHIHK